MRVRRVVGADARAGWFALVVTALAAPFASSVAADAPRILYFETLPSLSLPSAATRKTSAAESLLLRFDAYGRRFEISLDSNTRLLDELRGKTGGSALKLYAGRLEGNSRSWVRLATNGDEVHGMVWDGASLYVIEPAYQLADSVVAPAAIGAAGTLIFRLEDVLLDSAAAACSSAASSEARTGSEAFASLLDELKGSASVAMQAGGAARGLTLSALGDAQFLARHPSEQSARDAILIRLNNVDGIYSAQLGIQIRVGDLFVHEASSDPLSGATSPNDLLRELGWLRKRSPELNSHGLTHLFTGRDLDGTTIGIAYVDSLCQPEHGAGLTETRNTWLDSLVAAHEIGHNFGADHDGDASGSCASTSSTGYLMSPIVSGSDAFSQCSLTRMRSRAQTASCISSLPPANVTIPADLGNVRKAVSTAFEFLVHVTNSGGLSAQNVRANLWVGSAISLEEAYVEGGSCISGAGAIQCQLGELSGGWTRSIHLRLRSDTLGTGAISASISADNDYSFADNDGTGSIAIQSEADLELTLQGPPSATPRNAFELSFQVANKTAKDADGVNVVLDLPSAVSAQSASIANGTCSILGGSVRCVLSSLAAGATLSGVASITAASAGTVIVHASVSGGYLDPNAANDQAELTVNVTGDGTSSTAQTRTSGNGGSGGGGSFSLLLLLGLAALRIASTISPTLLRLRGRAGRGESSLTSYQSLS